MDDDRRRMTTPARRVDPQLIAFAALATLLALLLFAGPARPRHAAVPGPAVPRSPAASPGGTAPPAAENAVPVRIVIPAAGVDAVLEHVGVTATGALGTPDNPSDAAWYAAGPAPGAPGDAVIDGHLDWYNGPAVFWRLGEVPLGATITITMSRGPARSFQVVSRHSYPYTQEPAGLFATTGPATLSLITCAGAWDEGRQIYRQRLVVTAASTSPA